MPIQELAACGSHSLRLYQFADVLSCKLSSVFKGPGGRCRRPYKKRILGPGAHFYIKSNLVINGAWAGQNGSKTVPKASQGMQLLIPKVWRDLAKLDFRTPRAQFFFVAWGVGQKCLLQPLGPHGSFMVAQLFNEEATISPPWSPMGSHGAPWAPKGPKKNWYFFWAGPAGW